MAKRRLTLSLPLSLTLPPEVYAELERIAATQD